jgi:hypothetical protein
MSRMYVLLVVTIVGTMAVTATASYGAGFGVQFPGGNDLLTFKMVGAEETIEVINQEPVVAKPTRLKEVFENNTNESGEQYITFNQAEIKTCREKEYNPGAVCNFKVKYAKERPNGKPIAIAEIEPEPAGCPNMVNIKA